MSAAMSSNFLAMNAFLGIVRCFCAQGYGGSGERILK